MDLLNRFFDIAANPAGIPSPAMIDQLEQRYPYFVLPAMIMLERGGSAIGDDRRRLLATRVALQCGNPDTLFTITSDIAGHFADIYPPDKDNTPETTDAIDTFLAHYSSADDERETALLERLIFNPVPDYASQLDDTPQQAPDGASAPDNPDSLASLGALLQSINAPAGDPEKIAENETNATYVAKTATAEPQKETQKADMTSDTSSARPTSPNSTFSESLAKIYIRQQRYDKALEIISQLSLNFPEKSIYFADQIRFLQKLIINRSYNS